MHGTIPPVQREHFNGQKSTILVCQLKFSLKQRLFVVKITFYNDIEARKKCFLTPIVVMCGGYDMCPATHDQDERS